jgi:thiamine-monophosphate kinase
MIRLGPGGEFDRIRRILGEPAPWAGVLVGPGDDATVLEAGEPLVLSSDLSIEGVHFKREWLSPEEIGYRAVAAALSDLAAMAAEPVGVLVSLALPDGGDDEVGRLAMGFHEALAQAPGTLLGGDLSRSPGPLILDVMAVGRTDRPLLRSGALPGDVPRIAESVWLKARASVHAGMDLSDGLGRDAWHLASASGMDVILFEEAIPVHPELSGEANRWELALGGGEDYELLLAAAPGQLDDVQEEFEARFSVPLSRVGRVEEGTGLVFLVPTEGERTLLEPLGFDHFQTGESI